MEPPKSVRRVVVTEESVLRFIDAIGDTPRRVEGALEVPLLYYQAHAYAPVPQAELPADGTPKELDAPIAATRTVGGSSEYVVHRRARIGETLLVSAQLKSVEQKSGQSGMFYLVSVETQFHDLHGQLLAYEVASYVKR